ncbi:hypothetical protein BU24DRAFT_408988 [Aaosphaeria arxii CBS 175.79]|uniref:Uncharacterized protein n=1 Tax=Aaosphaeria arxii CBS 175.79 TaxID=1450172 RepID=A0A6A5XU85_9PLEO|nr:uncharacterized protein BU24DRAFT_408988 [Aaosphaeria arxii CBS 175.79]KAF2015804.1 hypothetical protein BU24DRAFT_408988 [Aaosphaeria arxii CBS 175.79]
MRSSDLYLEDMSALEDMKELHAASECHLSQCQGREPSPDVLPLERKPPSITSSQHSRNTSRSSTRINRERIEVYRDDIGASVGGSNTLAGFAAKSNNVDNEDRRRRELPSIADKHLKKEGQPTKTEGPHIPEVLDAKMSQPGNALRDITEQYNEYTQDKRSLATVSRICIELRRIAAERQSLSRALDALDIQEQDLLNALFKASGSDIPGGPLAKSDIDQREGTRCENSSSLSRGTGKLQTVPTEARFSHSQSLQGSLHGRSPLYSSPTGADKHFISSRTNRPGNLDLEIGNDLSHRTLRQTPSRLPTPVRTRAKVCSPATVTPTRTLEGSKLPVFSGIRKTKESSKGLETVRSSRYKGSCEQKTTPSNRNIGKVSATVARKKWEF